MRSRRPAACWGLAVAALTTVGLVPAAQAKTVTVIAKDFSFAPATVKIKKNDRVRWKNAQGTHTVTMSAGGQNLDDVLSGSGSVKSGKFKKKGSFSYLCSLHTDEGMRGKVVVK